MQLTNEERLELQNKKLIMDQLKLKHDIVKSEYINLVKNICLKNNKKMEDITGVNLDAGIINYKEEKPELKKKK